MLSSRCGGHFEIKVFPREKVMDVKNICAAGTFVQGSRFSGGPMLQANSSNASLPSSLLPSSCKHRQTLSNSLSSTTTQRNSNMAPADSARIAEAKKLAKTDPKKAEAQYKDIISKPPSVTSDAAVREYETALVSLGELYRDEK
jgi:hypothetical protein